MRSSADGKVYFNSRRPVIGNQDIDLKLEVSGNVGAATGQVLMSAIDEMLSRLRVSMCGAEVINK